MSQTKVTISVFLLTTATSRIADYVGDVFATAQKHVGHGFHSEMAGPFPDGYQEAHRVYHGSTKSSGGNAVVGRADAEQDGNASSDTGSGDQQPKRGRGRPRKEAGQAAQGPERGDDAEDGSAGKGSERNVAGRADEDGSEGAGERAEGGRGSDRGGERTGSSGSSHSVSDVDWGDEPADDLEQEGEDFHAKTPGDAWPDSLTPKIVDKTVLSALLGDHFKAAGGKDRDLTFDVMERVTKERRIADVAEEDYRKLAKALIKEIARYKLGLKKAK